MILYTRKAYSINYLFTPGIFRRSRFRDSYNVEMYLCTLYKPILYLKRVHSCFLHHPRPTHQRLEPRINVTEVRSLEWRS